VVLIKFLSIILGLNVNYDLIYEVIRKYYAIYLIACKTVFCGFYSIGLCIENGQAMCVFGVIGFLKKQPKAREAVSKITLPGSKKR
jgi:hypothetical protein